MGKLNWKVRLRNPQFLAQIVVSIFIPILAYAGITAQDVTTWAMVGELLLEAISNPYVLILVLTSVYNSINDPTVAGFFDSEQALMYEKPKKNDDVDYL